MSQLPGKTLDLHVFFSEDYEEYCEKLKHSRVPLSRFPFYPVCDIIPDMNQIDQTYALHSANIPPNEALVHSINEDPQTVELWIRKPKESQMIVFEVFQDVTDDSHGVQYDFVGHFTSTFAMQNVPHYTIPLDDKSSSFVPFESTIANNVELLVAMRVSNAQKLQEVTEELRSASHHTYNGPFPTPPNSDPSLASFPSRSWKPRSASTAITERSRKRLSVSATVSDRPPTPPSPPCIFEAIAEHPRVKNLLHELEDKQESLKCLGVEIIYLRKQLSAAETEKENILQERENLSKEKEELKERFVQHVKAERTQMKKIDSLSQTELATLLKKHGKAHKIEKYKRKQLQTENASLVERIQHLENESNRLRSASVQQLIHIQELQRERRKNMKWKETADCQEKVILGLETVLKKLDAALRKTSKHPDSVEEEMNEHQKEEMKRARDTLHEMEKKLEEKEKELEKKKQEYLVLEFQLKQSEARKNALENELKESAARYGKEIAILKLSQDAGDDFDDSDEGFSLDEDLSFDVTSANTPSPSVGDA